MDGWMDTGWMDGRTTWSLDYFCLNLHAIQALNYVCLCDKKVSHCDVTKGTDASLHLGLVARPARHRFLLLNV